MKKAFIVLMALGFLSTPLMAQNPNRIQDQGNYNFTENKKASDYYNQGLIDFKKGDYKKAISFYKKAIKEDKEFVEAYDNLGLSYRQLGDLDKAEKYYKISIELYPGGKTAIQNLAVVYQLKKDYRNALLLYENIIKVDPHNPEGYYGACKIYLSLENYEKSVEKGLLAEKYYKLNQSPYVQDSQYLVGLSYYFMDDNDNAKEYLQLAKDNGMDVPEQLVDKLKLN